MNTKTLLAGLVGGVAAFFLGWGIYGWLLESFMKANTNQCFALADMKDMNMIGMIASNLAWGFLYAFILSWANATNFMSGATKGAIVGLLFALSMDLFFYSMTTYFTSMNGLLVDVLASTVMSAIIGGIIGWMLGRGNTAAA